MEVLPRLERRTHYLLRLPTCHAACLLGTISVSSRRSPRWPLPGRQRSRDPGIEHFGGDEHHRLGLIVAIPLLLVYSVLQSKTRRCRQPEMAAVNF